MSYQAEIKSLKQDLAVVRDPWVRAELRRRLRDLEDLERNHCGVPCQMWPMCPCGGGG